mmetsp:Transcript_24499/g.37219  ORF Transcript_24499/g.37219 Transcript_24499/m.37219 type:complete len:222 (+) Transcript_24499:2-667(+)
MLRGNATAAHSTSVPTKPPALLLGDINQQCKCSFLPFLAWALPFLLRARQCLITSRQAPDSLTKTLQRVNLLKYLTAVPVIFFAFLYTQPDAASPLGYSSQDFEFMFAIAAVVNSMFSYLWDLVMDWGLLQAGAEPFGLRSVLLFRGIWGCYYLVIVTNLVGRGLWSLRWVPQVVVFFGPFTLVTLQQAAEVSRRCMWNIIRVEWECIKKNVHRADKQFQV